MRYIKRHWWLIFLLVATPIIVNVILIAPSPFPALTSDGNNGWLGFWGAFLGAMFPFIALYITIKENKEEAERNRMTQTAEINYRLAKENLRSVKQNIASFQKAVYSPEIDLVSTANKNNASSSQTLLWKINKDLISSYNLLDFELIEYRDENEMKFKEYIERFFVDLTLLIKDMSWLLDYLKDGTPFLDLESYKKQELAELGAKDENKRIWNVISTEGFNIDRDFRNVTGELFDRVNFNEFYKKSRKFVIYENKKIETDYKNALEKAKGQ